MRNLKRALSLALAAMMLIGMMVVSAGAASKDFTDKDEITHSEAVNTLVALNVIGGKEDGSYFDPTGTLTRAEMAKLVTYVLNGGVEPVLGTKVTPTYSDIKGHWAEAYIEYCTSMNIIVGDGTGKFNPEGTLTASQCAKMLLTAMNYKDDVFGFVGNSWEINVNREANAAGLYKELGSISASSPISRDNAAQMVYNAIQSKTMRLSWQQDMTTGQITQVYNLTGDPLFVDKFGGKIFIGTFTGNKATGATGVAGEIAVYGRLDSQNTGDRTASFPGDLALSNIGEQVKVLFKDGTGGIANQPDKKDTIYGVYNTGSTQVLNTTVAAINDDLSGADNTNKVEINDVKYEVAPATAVNEEGTAFSTVVVKNYGASTISAGAASASAVKTVIEGLSAAKGDTVKFIFNSDGKISMAYVVESKLATVTAVNSEKVTMNNGVGSIKIADNEIYDGIAKNDVVVVTTLYKSTATADGAYTIVEKADVVSGTVNGYNGTKSVTVDGTVYKIYGEAAMPETVGGESDGVDNFATSDIGETFDLYLVNGYVAAALQTSESATNYSLVIDDNNGTAGSALSALKIVVLGADGTKTTLTVSDKGDTAFEVGDLVTYTGSADNAKVTKCELKTNTDAAKYDKTAKTFAGVVTAADCVLFRSTDQAFGVGTSMTNEGTFKAYNIRNMKDFDVSASSYNYVVNDDGMVVAVLVGNRTSVSTNTSDAVIGIVSASNGVVKFDDVPYNQYTIVSNDKTYTVNIEDGSTYDSLKKGDIVAFAPSSDDLYDGKNEHQFEVLSAAAKYDDTEKTIDGTEYDVSTVAVKNYDESEGLLTYYTGTTGNASDGYNGTGSAITKAVADDLVIVYVNVDKDTSGDEIGINSFDSVTGYLNAIILVNSDGVISHVVVETSGTDNVFAQNDD